MKIKFLAVLVVLACAALMGAGAATADMPVVHYGHDVFVDINPCTGLEHTVTADVTVYETNPGFSHATDSISTSSGFIGRGEEAGVFHASIFELNHMLVNRETGQRIHAHLVLVTNPATGELQVFQLSLTCIPPGQA
jgi:hypothetical protein